MDFLDPKKKRAHTIRLYIGYALMAVALVIGTTILVFEAYGFDVNKTSGEVIQNGLVFVDAHPEAANIYLNGQAQSQTDARLVVPAGNYNLELRHDGYRTWKKAFTLEGHTIERFIYPFLFPSKFSPKDVHVYDANPSLTTESPDRHWLLLQQPGQLNKFDQVDMSSTKSTTSSFAVPETVFTATGTNHRLELVEWSTDNKHVLLKHEYDGGAEFVVVNRDAPEASLNVNKLFNVPITQATLRDKSADSMYILDGASGTLRLGDVKAKTATIALEKVLDFRPHGSEQVLYATPSTDGVNVDIKLRDNSQTVTLRKIAKSDKYLLDIARYDGKWYVALGATNDSKLYIYRDPFSQAKTASKKILPYRVLRLDAPKFVSFSGTARFIGLQSGSSFAVFDAETSRQYKFQINLNIPQAYKALWMDGHRYAVVSDNKVNVFEFDGQNQQTLVDATPAAAPYFDRDYTAMYSLGPSTTKATAGKPAVLRSELKVKK